MQDDLDTWDPLHEEYNSVAFNSYTSGPGANLPLEYLPPFKQEATQNKSRTLCVKNVPVGLTEVGLRNLFYNCGRVLSIRKLSPKPDFPDKTIAFIDYGTTLEALSAIETLHDQPPFYLKVNIAMSLQERRRIEQRQKEELEVIRRQIEHAKAAIEPGRSSPKLGRGRGLPPQKVLTLNDLKNIKVTVGKSVGQRSVKSSDTSSSSSASYKTTRESVADSDSSGSRGDGPSRTCSRCGKKANMRCSICAVIYCSRECQVQDWPEHLKECLKKAGQKRTGKSSSSSDSDFVDSKVDYSQRNGVQEPPPTKATSPLLKSPQKPLSALGQHLAQKAVPEKPVAASKPNQVVKLEAAKLPPGETVEVILSNVGISLEDIYIQQLSHHAALAELHLKLQSLCKGAAGYEPRKGVLCCAIYVGEWYRACAMDILAGGGCRVYFVDYGNEATVPFADTCALPDGCADLPEQAIHCRLHGIRLKDDDTEGVLKELCQLMSSGVPLSAKLMKVAEDGRNEVELFCKGGQSLACFLRSKGLIPPEPSQKSPTKKDRLGSVLDQSQAGTELLLQVTVSGTDKIWCTAFDLGMQEIEKDLNATCPTLARSAPKSFSVGDCVAAQSLEDGCWYRAAVIRLSAKERWVRYLDYGNEEVNTTVVPLDPKHKRLLPRAVHLSGPASLKVGDILTAKIMQVAEGNVVADLFDGEGAKKIATSKLGPWHFVIDSQGATGSLSNDVVEGAFPSASAAATPPTHTPFKAEQLVPKVIHIPARSVPEKKCSMRLVWKTPDVLFLQQESLLPSLAEMMDKLNEWAKDSKETRRHFDDGEYVAAYFKDAAAWHRGKVVGDKHEDGSYLVMLIDFGNTELIPQSSLRCLPPEFADYAIFAYCVMPDSGVLPNDPRLEKMLNEEPFAAIQVGKCRGVPAVKLVRKDGTCITDVLGEGGRDTVLAKSPKASTLQPSLVIPPCPVPSQNFQATVTSADGRTYYIQPFSRGEGLLKVMTTLQTPPAEPLASFKPGDFLVARSSEDNCWYRAQVRSLVAGGNKAEVYFVDFGNCEVVDRAALKPLSVPLSQEPACVLAVELDKVPALTPEDVAVLVNEEMKIEVVGGDAEKLKVRMTTNSGDCINDILAIEEVPAEPVKLHIPESKLPAGRSEAVFAERAGNIVYLHLTSSVDLLESLLNELNSSVPTAVPQVVAEGDAIAVQPPGEELWHRGTVLSLNGSGLVRVLLVDAGRIEEVPKEALRSPSAKLAALPALTVPVRLHGLPDLTDAMLEPLKDTAVMVEAVDTSASPPVVKLYDTAGECINGALKQALTERKVSTPPQVSAQQQQGLSERRLPGGRIAVTIVGASPEGAVLTVLRTSLAEELSNMMAELNSVVSTLPLAKDLQPHSYVCAKYVDGLWYRAQVLSKGKAGLVVLFVDFGNTEEVSTNDLKALPEAFQSIPLFVNRVSIAGVSKIREDFCKSSAEIPACIEVVDGSKNPPSVNVFSEDGTPLNSEFECS